MAEGAVDRANGIVNMAKLTVVTDAGIIIDPESTTAQTESAALCGKCMALFEGTVSVVGQVSDTNLNTHTADRIGNVPGLDIRFIASAAVPVGLGGPATTVPSPAIAYVVFAAAGSRVTHLPITPQAVLAALAQIQH